LRAAVGTMQRVRVEAWLRKLSEATASVPAWKKNRNNYARLLLDELRSGRFGHAVVRTHG
jgi:hypothetical protein